MATITIEFELYSKSTWLLSQLDNRNVLLDLAERAMLDFKRDLLKRSGPMGPDAVTASLVNAQARN